MAKKRKKGGKSPDQLRDEAKKYSEKAKSNFKDAGKAFIHGSHQGVRSLYGAAKGAIKAAPLGDKTPILKGAWNGFWDTEPFKEGTKDIGKFYGGLAKGMINSAMSKQLNKQAKTKEFMNKLFNDLSWYGNYPDSTLEMIGPNFNTRMGISEPFYNLGGVSQANYSVPTYAQVQYWLTRGDDTNGTVTAAINRLYTSIRQANSGAVNWQPYHLDAYIYNWRVIIALYSQVCRALRYLNKYSVVDKNVPYTMFSALGFDYDKLAQNAAIARNKLLSIRTRLMGYAIPQLDLLKRTYWLSSHTFWDSDDIKHQNFVTVANIKFYYSLTGNTLTNLTNSFPVGPSNSADGADVLDVLDSLDTLCKEFMSNDIYSIISGDIVKAYGTDNLFILDTIPSPEELPSEGYSEEVLQQIQNAYLLHSAGSGTLQFNVTHPTTGSVGLKETISFTESTFNNIPTSLDSSTLINMYKNNITNLDVLGATRFTSFVSRNSSTFTVATYGTELFDNILVPYYNYASIITNPHKVQAVRLFSLTIMNYDQAVSIADNSFKIDVWSIFDWMPKVFQSINFYTSGATSYTTKIGAMLFDLNNYAKLDTIEQLRAIHDVATQSLYYTPLLSRVSSNVIEYGK